jgi:hypothetical protein
MLATLAPRPMQQQDNDADIGTLLRKTNLAAPTAQTKSSTIVPPMKPTAAEPAARPTITPLPLRATPPHGNDGVTRVSLRMNSARHRRLRIAAAQLGLSNTSMMVTAINHYLDHVLPKLMADETAGPQHVRAPAAANWAALSLGSTQPGRTP